MRKILGKVWEIVKMFPFSSYEVMLIAFRLLLLLSGVDSNSGVSLLFILLVYPVLFFGSFINPNLGEAWFVCSILFYTLLLDLLILTFRKKFLPLIKKKFLPSIKPKLNISTTPIKPKLEMRKKQ